MCPPNRLQLLAGLDVSTAGSVLVKSAGEGAAAVGQQRRARDPLGEPPEIRSVLSGFDVEDAYRPDSVFKTA